MVSFGCYESEGLERRLLATVRWTVANAVAFPQKSEPLLYVHYKTQKTAANLPLHSCNKYYIITSVM